MFLVISCLKNKAFSQSFFKERGNLSVLKVRELMQWGIGNVYFVDN